MCDYSLAGVPTRLAAAGDQLMVYRFPSGSLGMVSAKRRFREILFPSLACAVCIPPGARLRLEDIPAALQQQLGVSATEEVAFTQRTWEAYIHRDSVRFRNGTEVSLQQLRRGQRVTVLSLAPDEPADAPELAGERLEPLTSARL
ncbi:MAG TPA: hypothetical protein VKV17_01140 [Bryobacteraceae bacterium]|nr:hypothetical protein [Bryobacteraceae bacterium]